LLDRGTIIDDKYEVLTFIGKGGMSKVYLAKDLRLNKQWAIKEIEKKGKKSGYIIESALAEANLIKRLDHPMLPRIVDIIDSENEIYIVMDYIEGEPLNKIIEKNGPQPQFAVIEWAKQLCQVLEYLHTRKPPIVYRDMKPGNIMLKPEGNIKLIDFGIAREYKEESDSDTTCLGTKGYAAPEQFGGKGQTDARTDVYCLGVTIYHLVTGHNPTEPPYEIRPIRQWNDKLSGGLEKIIIKATQYNPEDRYQSCAEMLYALNHYEEVDDAYYVKQKRKLRSFLTVAISSLVCLGLAIGGVFYRKTLIKNNYDQLIYQAANATEDEKKEELLIDAAEVEPTRLEAYNELIKMYRSDSCFSQKEEEVLIKHIKKDTEVHDKLAKQDGYSDLAYEIGCAYWYFYKYDSESAKDIENKTNSAGMNENQIGRMKDSVRWFSEVKNSKDENKNKLAKIYCNIGKFHGEVTANIDQGRTQGKFSDYWKDMQEMLKNTNEDDEEIIKLEVYRLIASSLATYMKQFLTDNVPQGEIDKMLEEVKQKNALVNTITDKTSAMKRQVEFDIDTAIKNKDLNLQKKGGLNNWTNQQ